MRHARRLGQAAPLLVGASGVKEERLCWPKQKEAHLWNDAGGKGGVRQHNETQGARRGCGSHVVPEGLPEELMPRLIYSVRRV